MKKILLLTILLFYSLVIKAQWKPINLPPNPYIKSLTVSGSNIYAGSYDSIYFSSNNFKSWSLNRISNQVNYSKVGSLLISGGNVIAGVNPGGSGCRSNCGIGIYVSSNNGSSWKLGIGLPIIVGAYTLVNSGSNIFAGYDGVYMSNDNGNSWNSRSTGFPINSIIISMAVNGNNIYAGTNNFGVFLSTDNGSNWKSVNNGLVYVNGIYSLVSSGPNLFAGTDGYGMYMSSDNGNSWKAINTGYPSNRGLISSMVMSGSNIFSANLFSEIGIYWSNNNGNTWTAVNSGLPANNYINALAIKGDTIYAGLEPKGLWTRSISEMTLITI
jgi:hypothetical protein